MSTVRSNEERRHLGVYEVVTIVLLLPGWLGWLVAFGGLLMLWAGPWRIRQKAVGTLIPLATSGLEILLLTGHPVSTPLTVLVWACVLGLTFVVLGAIRVLATGLR